MGFTSDVLLDTVERNKCSQQQKVHRRNARHKILSRKIEGVRGSYSKDGKEVQKLFSAKTERKKKRTERLLHGEVRKGFTKDKDVTKIAR